jgi:hypothetical protein
MKRQKNMNSNDFRKDLQKEMPGYKWTVRRPRSDWFLMALGIQTSGYNRMSTLLVERRALSGDAAEYTVRYSGFGAKAPWIGQATEVTLVRALRELQQRFEWERNKYHAAAVTLADAREHKGYPEVHHG